jgi:hypothetical protein
MDVSGHLHARRFTPREGVSGIHWIGGRVGTRVGLDTVMKRKISSLCPESDPRTAIVQPIKH